MKILKLILLVVVAILIESLWSFSNRPDLFLVLVISYSVWQATEGGVVFGFCLGFIQDILFSLNFFNTLIKTAVAIVIALIKDKLILNFEKLTLVLVLVISPIAILFKALLNQTICPDLLLTAVIGSVLNLVFALILIWIVRKFEIYGQ